MQSHSHNYENCGLGKRLVKRELEKMPKVEKRKEVATRKLCRYTNAGYYPRCEEMRV